MKSEFNPEILYELLEQQKWNDFLLLLHRQKKEVSQNQVAMQTKEIFIAEFLKHVESLTPTIFKDVFELLLLMHSENHFQLNETELKKIVYYNLNALKIIDEEKAIRFATTWKQFDFTNMYLKEIFENQPIYVNHNNIDSIQVTINKNVQPNNYTISLFKSPQEYDFFRAVKELFPNYQTYPNVALSCIIDFNKIKAELDKFQKEYFLKSIVDCVVYDPDDKYKPKYFFELDSSYHDNEKTKQKDLWKDMFFSKAGSKLFRIRPKRKGIKKKNFLELLKELCI